MVCTNKNQTAAPLRISNMPFTRNYHVDGFKKKYKAPVIRYKTLESSMGMFHLKTQNGKRFTPPPEMLCSLCGDVSRTPVYACEGGCMWCDNCRVHFIESKQMANQDPAAVITCCKCFKPMKPQEEVSINSAAEQQINCLYVKCAQNGCTWTGSYSNWKSTHIETCPMTKVHCPNGCKFILYLQTLDYHLESCAMTHGICMNTDCRKKVLIKDYNIHLKTCMRRVFKCNYPCCGADVPLFAKALHEAACVHRPDTCTDCHEMACNAVHRTATAGLAAQHGLLHQHPRFSDQLKTTCPFFLAGCDWVGKHVHKNAHMKFSHNGEQLTAESPLLPLRVDEIVYQVTQVIERDREVGGHTASSVCMLITNPTHAHWSVRIALLSAARKGYITQLSKDLFTHNDSRLARLHRGELQLTPEKPPYESV